VQHLGQLIERIARRVKAPQYDASYATMNVADTRVILDCCVLLRHDTPGLIIARSVGFLAG